MDKVTGTVLASTEDLIHFFQATKDEGESKLCGGRWIVKLHRAVADKREEEGREPQKAKKAKATRKTKKSLLCLFGNCDPDACTETDDQDQETKFIGIEMLRFLARNSVAYDLKETKVLDHCRGLPRVHLCAKHWEMLETGLRLEQLIADMESQLKGIRTLITATVGPDPAVKIKEEKPESSDLEEDAFGVLMPELGCNWEAEESEFRKPVISSGLLSCTVQEQLQDVDFDFCELGPTTEVQDSACGKPVRKVKSKHQPRANKNFSWQVEDADADMSNGVTYSDNEGSHDLNIGDDNEDDYFSVQNDDDNVEDSDSEGSEIQGDESENPESDEDWKRSKNRRKRKQKGQSTKTSSCPICWKSFPTTAEKMDHFAQAYGVSPRFQCPVCPAIYSHFKDVKEHYKKRHSVSVFQFPCRYCPEAFITSLERSVHESRCRLGKPRKTRTGTRQKKETKKRETTRCRVCWKTFPSVIERREHEKIYGEPPIFRCVVCPKVLTTMYDMGLHFQTKHAVPILKYPCRHCSEAFLFFKHRRIHEETFHSAVVECPICKKPYLSIQYLKTHMDRYHNPSKDPNEHKKFCEICGARFSRIPDLIKHQNRNHFNTHQLSECDICGKKLSDKNSLKKHKFSQHMKTYQFKCPICGSQSLFKSHLAAHIKNSHKNLSEEEVEDILASCKKVLDSTDPRKQVLPSVVSLDDARLKRKGVRKKKEPKELISI